MPDRVVRASLSSPTDISPYRQFKCLEVKEGLVILLRFELLRRGSVFQDSPPISPRCSISTNKRYIEARTRFNVFGRTKSCRVSVKFAAKLLAEATRSRNVVSPSISAETVEKRLESPNDFISRICNPYEFKLRMALRLNESARNASARIEFKKLSCDNRSRLHPNNRSLQVIDIDQFVADHNSPV
jgi:hypothetical protein